MLEKQIQKLPPSYKNKSISIENIPIETIECEELQNQIKELRQRLEIIQQEYIEYDIDDKFDCSEKSKNSELLNQEIEAAQKKICFLERKYKDLGITWLHLDQNDFFDIKCKYEVLERKYNDLEVRYDELNKIVGDSSWLESENDNLQTEIRKLRKLIKTMEQELSDGESEESQQSLSGENDNIEHKLQASEEKYDSLRQENDELSPKLEVLEKEPLQNEVKEYVIDNLEQQLHHQKEKNVAALESSQSQDIQSKKHESCSCIEYQKQIEDLLKEKTELKNLLKKYMSNDESNSPNQKVFNQLQTNVDDIENVEVKSLEEERENKNLDLEKQIKELQGELQTQKCLSGEFKDSLLTIRTTLDGSVQCDNVEDTSAYMDTSTSYLEGQKIREERFQIEKAIKEKIIKISKFIDKKNLINLELKGTLEKKETLIAERDKEIGKLNVELKTLKEDMEEASQQISILNQECKKFIKETMTDEKYSDVISDFQNRGSKKLENCLKEFCKNFSALVEESVRKSLEFDKQHHDIIEYRKEIKILLDEKAELQKKIYENLNIKEDYARLIKSKDLFAYKLKEVKEKIINKLKTIFVSFVNFRLDLIKTLEMQGIQNEEHFQKEIRSLQDNLVNERMSAMEKNESMNLKFESLTVDYEGILLEYGHLKTVLESKKNQERKHRKEIEKLKYQLNSKKNQILGKNFEHRWQLKKFQLKCESLEEKNKEYVHRLDQANKDLKELQIEKHTLKNDLKKLSLQLNYAKKQIQKNKCSKYELSSSISIPDEKLFSIQKERKNRRLNTHDENRLQLSQFERLNTMASLGTTEICQCAELKEKLLKFETQFLRNKTLNLQIYTNSLQLGGLGE